MPIMGFACGLQIGAHKPSPFTRWDNPLFLLLDGAVSTAAVVANLAEHTVTGFVTNTSLP